MLINKLEYENILKHNLYYMDLNVSNIYNDIKLYNDELYSGLGFLETFPEECLGELIVYLNGTRNGICRSWHNNGCIKSEILYNDIVDGYYRKYDENSNMIEELVYISGLCIYKNIKDSEDVIYYDNIKICIDLFKQGKIKYLNHSSNIIEKNFKDSKYINGLLEIFNKYTDNLDINNIEDIAKEIIEYIKLQLKIRNRDYCMYNKVTREENLIKLNDNMMLDGKLFTGLSIKITYEEKVNFDIIYRITGYKDGIKDGIELFYDSEGILNPQHIEKFSHIEDDISWDSKEILNKVNLYKKGILVNTQEWTNDI